MQTWPLLVEKTESITENLIDVRSIANTMIGEAVEWWWRIEDGRLQLPNWRRRNDFSEQKGESNGQWSRTKPVDQWTDQCNDY